MLFFLESCAQVVFCRFAFRRSLLGSTWQGLADQSPGNVPFYPAPLQGSAALKCPRPWVTELLVMWIRCHVQRSPGAGLSALPLFFRGPGLLCTGDGERSLRGAC